jgi:N-methylhydantoinase B
MKTDPIVLEILSNRFRAIADEMADTIHRTAFSVFVKETGDYVAGLSTLSGETFAFPAIFPPMMIGDDASTAFAHVSEYRAGDIVLTNDPFTTGGWMTHLNDLHMFRPVFVEGELVCFVWDFLHLSDVGGGTPGSISPSNSEVFQEGIRIPPTKLYREGVLDESVAEILGSNTRTPDLNWGDINSLVAALNLGEQRMHEVIRKYGLSVVKQGIVDLLEYGELRARALIERIPDGEYAFADYLEIQDFARPVRISVKATVVGSSIHLDFAGTDQQVPLAYNFLAGGRRHGEAIFGVANLLRAMDPTIPANAGLLRPVTAEIPAGSILNPVGRPALGVRMATLWRVMDVIHGALAQAVPSLIPAGSGDRTLIFLAIDRQGTDHKPVVSLLQPSLGGSGARESRDGIDGLDAISWLRNVPTESLESDLPILVTQYRLAEAEGAGTFRGGRGPVFEFQVGVDFRVVARNRNRRRLRPWGRAGGLPGGHARVVVNPGTERERQFETVGVLQLLAGDAIRFVSSSGGGFGDPTKRDPGAVLRDVLDGAISADAAARVYGVVMSDGTIDEAATQRRRAQVQNVAPAQTAFTFGHERGEVESALQG